MLAVARPWRCARSLSRRTLAPDRRDNHREQAMPEPTHYSYMLRLWRERADAPWRVTLIAVAQPDQRLHFDTLEDCFAFLHEQTGSRDGSSIRLHGTSPVASQRG